MDLEQSKKEENYLLSLTFPHMLSTKICQSPSYEVSGLSTRTNTENINHTDLKSVKLRTETDELISKYRISRSVIIASEHNQIYKNNRDDKKENENKNIPAQKILNEIRGCTSKLKLKQGLCK